MSPLPRLTTALMFSFLTTVASFYLMKTLITTKFTAPDVQPSIIIDLVRPMEMADLIVKPPKPTPPPEPAAVPDKPQLTLPGEVIGGIKVQTMDPIADVGPQQFGPSDGTYLPLVQVQPTYPRRALSRGIEGFTVVEFDISPQGLVMNPRVIATSNEVFNASALKAILKFKFKPKVENGSPVTVYGARNKFSFELAAG